MKEGFLFNGIALHSSGVPPGHAQLSGAIKSDFAHSSLALWYGAAMAAGEASYAVIAEIFDQRGFGFADPLVEDVTQGGHGSCIYFSAGEKQYRVPSTQFQLFRIVYGSL